MFSGQQTHVPIPTGADITMTKAESILLKVRYSILVMASCVIWATLINSPDLAFQLCNVPIMWEAEIFNTCCESLGTTEESLEQQVHARILQSANLSLQLILSLPTWTILWSSAETPLKLEKRLFGYQLKPLIFHCTHCQRKFSVTSGIKERTGWMGRCCWELCCAYYWSFSKI